LFVFWLLILISLLASTADNFFVIQLGFHSFSNFSLSVIKHKIETISAKLSLPDDVAGVTLLAMGNGAPDVFTALSGINGTFHDCPSKHFTFLLFFGNRCK